MVGEVVKASDPILRRRSELIKRITPKIEGIAEEMVNFMDNHSKDTNNPIGLSACQLGYLVKMIAFRRNPQVLFEKDDIQILINPELVYAKKQYIVKEGSVSLPNQIYQLQRHKLVKIRGTTLDGNTRSFRGRDLLAQVFQHELNHLDGILLDQIGTLVVK